MRGDLGMLCGRQLHALVIKDHNGMELGRIQEVLADPTNGRIFGFLVDTSSLLTRRCFLPMDQVRQLSLRGVVVDGRAALRKAERTLPGEAQLAQRGRTVYRMNGASGVIADILVEQDQVCGWEISQGLLHDLRHKRRFLPREQAENRGGAFIEIDQSSF